MNGAFVSAPIFQVVCHFEAFLWRIHGKIDILLIVSFLA